MHPAISERMRNISPSAVREIFKALSDPEVISFAGGNPSPLTFPVEELERVSAKMYAEGAAAFLQYGITEGYGPLRELTKERMNGKYGIFGNDDEVIISSGGAQGIDLALKVLTNEGDTVICEDPSFIGALNDIRSYSLRLCGIPVDNEGMDIEALERALQNESRVSMIYTIPTFQNPTGVTMSMERRKKLYELAVKYNVAVLEDSPYFELRYSGTDIPCIKSLDKTGHVVFCGSYSKIVAPGLRVGFIIAHKDIIQKLTVAKQCADVHTPVYCQMLIAKYLESGDIDGHIVQCRRLYASQRDSMLRAIEKHFHPAVKVTNPDGGLFLWCTLPDGTSGHELCLRTGQKKVVCVPGSAFDPAAWKDKPGMRLNFSMPSKEQIEKGIELVGECMKEYLGG